MLSSLEMVMRPGGGMKTLEDFIKDASGGGGVSAWEKVGEIKDLVFNTLTNIDAALNDIFDGKYTDLLMVMSLSDATYIYPIATMLIPGDYLKNNEDWFMFFSTANTAQAIGQSAIVYGFQFTEAAGVHKVTYKGANHYYNNGTKLTITFYAR